jgi:hypothetical protein
MPPFEWAGLEWMRKNPFSVSGQVRQPRDFETENQARAESKGRSAHPSNVKD